MPKGMGVCAITNSVDIAPSALGWGYDGNNTFAVFLSCYRPQTGSVALWMITIKEHSARSPQLRHGCPLCGHVAQVRQKVLSDFSKKFLRREISFRANPKAIVIAARVRPLCAFGANSPTPAFCGRTKSFALCGARVGAPPRHPASLREGLTQALLLVAHQNFVPA